MKDNIISVALQTSTAPVVTETRGKDWINYGDANGEWANLYPQFLIDLYYSSSISAAIINATAEMISAEDIVIEDEDDRDLEARVRLQHFMDRANCNETLHEVLKKVAFDFKLQGGFALNIVWARDRSKGISEIYHIPMEKIRAEKPDEMGKINGYYISTDWSNTRMNKPYRVDAFNMHDRTSANQILYTGLYSPNMNSYYTPDYVSCNNWALIDSRVSEFHLNNISNGFSGSFMISFANGVPTAEERHQIEQSLAAKFTSQDNAGKFVLTFSDDKTRTPEITPISPSDLDKQYLALQELLTQNILSGHRVTSPMLMGIKNDTGLGSNADELNSASNFYLNTVIKPYQNTILKVLHKIFKVNDMDMPVQFVQLKPITTRFTNQDLAGVMTQDEIREELGLAPLDVEVREDFSKVGNIDGKPVFDTIEEAEAHAKTLGCEGYHEHEYNGKTSYMACKDHSEATELSKFIAEFGEDIPEEWELLDEENANDEHEDFDFESELNKLAAKKLDLAVGTGTARPNARSSQDGVNKSYNEFYKVRYVYTKDGSLSQEGETRDFCKVMSSAKKIYRKEDLLQLTKKAVNPGWGPRGANTYSIWLYKGGGNCHHYFKRVVYRASLRAATKNINSSQIISDVKAISEGFTLKRNSGLVAKAPKTMKNNGFLKPR